MGFSLAVSLTGCEITQSNSPEPGTYAGSNGAVLILDGAGSAVLEEIPRVAVDGARGTVSGSAEWSFAHTTINFLGNDLKPQTLNTKGFYAIYAGGQTPTVSFFIGPIDDNDKIVLTRKQ